MGDFNEHAGGVHSASGELSGVPFGLVFQNDATRDHDDELATLHDVVTRLAGRFPRA